MDITAPNPCTHYSPVGIIPKLHQPGRFRLIVDLSSPQGASVNDAIPSDLALLQYPRVEQAIKLIAQHDRGILIAKLDLQSAYRKIPVHPADQHLLGISWEGATYTNKALPFGLCLEPKVFSAVADGFAWALVAQGFLKFVHCLDDFLFWSSSDSQECLLALQTAIHLGSELSLPPALEKVEGPTTSLMFLGIQVDSVSHQLCLPQTKLRRLKATLLHWSHTKSPMKRQLQSLLGTLHHTVLVSPSRSYLYLGAHRQHEVPQMPSASSYSAYSLCKSRHIMVAKFCRRLERCGLLPLRFLAATRPCDYVRCVRFLGLWCLLRYHLAVPNGLRTG